MTPLRHIYGSLISVYGRTEALRTETRAGLEPAWKELHPTVREALDTSIDLERCLELLKAADFTVGQTKLLDMRWMKFAIERLADPRLRRKLLNNSGTPVQFLREIMKSSGEHPVMMCSVSDAVELAEHPNADGKFLEELERYFREDVAVLLAIANNGRVRYKQWRVLSGHEDANVRAAAEANRKAAEYNAWWFEDVRA